MSFDLLLYKILLRLAAGMKTTLPPALFSCFLIFGIRGHLLIFLMLLPSLVSFLIEMNQISFNFQEL